MVADFMHELLLTFLNHLIADADNRSRWDDVMTSAFILSVMVVFPLYSVLCGKMTATNAKDKKVTISKSKSIASR